MRAKMISYTNRTTYSHICVRKKFLVVTFQKVRNLASQDYLIPSYGFQNMFLKYNNSVLPHSFFCLHIKSGILNILLLFCQKDS